MGDDDPAHGFRKYLVAAIMACWPAAYIGAALFPRDPTTWTMPSGQLDAVARRAGETRRRVPVRRRVAKLRIVWPATRALHHAHARRDRDLRRRRAPALFRSAGPA